MAAPGIVPPAPTPEPNVVEPLHGNGTSPIRSAAPTVSVVRRGTILAPKTRQRRREEETGGDDTVHILLRLVACPDGILSGPWRGFCHRITRVMAGNRAGNTWTTVAWCTCQLGIDCSEQLLHGARRRCAECLIKVDRLRKLLADEFITPREFAVARERLLNALGVAAA